MRTGSVGMGLVSPVHTKLTAVTALMGLWLMWLMVVSNTKGLSGTDETGWGSTWMGSVGEDNTNVVGYHVTRIKVGGAEIKVLIYLCCPVEPRRFLQHYTKCGAVCRW